MVRMMKNSFILFKVCLILVAVIQRAYLKKDHPKESHDPYCLFKKKKFHTEHQIFQNQPLFTRTWRLKCVENISSRIRIRELLLMSKFDNFKYDTEIYIKRILKIIHYINR